MRLFYKKTARNPRKTTSTTTFFVLHIGHFHFQVKSFNSVSEYLVWASLCLCARHIPVLELAELSFKTMTQQSDPHRTLQASLFSLR